MITINVRTATASGRNTVIKPVTTTPAEVFEELNIDISTSMVNMAGTTLRGSKLNETFEELGVDDGSTVTLSAIVKADGAIA